MSTPATYLAVGDPACRRATFTRFVLPFAWKAPKDPAPSEDNTWFRPAKEDDWLHNATCSGEDLGHFLDQSRRRYVTQETNRLLFERASWFVLKDDRRSGNENAHIWRKFSMKSDLGTPDYTVALRPPALVLFEWQKEPAPGDGEDPLRIGFLVHEAFFPEKDSAPSLGDLLRFNEIFRFWRSPFSEFEGAFCKVELDSLSEGIANGYDREENSDGEEDSKPNPAPNPSHFDQWERWLSQTVTVDERHSRRRWPRRWTRPSKPVKVDERHYELRAPETESDDAESKEDPVFPSWMVNPDDRAFTMPFVVLSGIASSRAVHFEPYRCGAGFPKKERQEPETGGLWVKLLNVDRVKPWEVRDLGRATHFERQWARDRTYARWSEGSDPSLYGFCEHSFAVMCNPAEKGQGEPPLGLHFGQMYFDATLLHLYIRVSLFRFSASLHRITAEARNETGWRQENERRREVRKWREPFHQLRWQFLQFQNLYRFPLFSNQQQHLEMNALQRKSMDVEELYAEVEKEVNSSDEFLENELAEERNRLAGMLNVVAAVGLAGALALGWMDAHSETQSGPAYFLALFLISLLLLLVATLFSSHAERTLNLLSAVGWRAKLPVALLLGGTLAASAIILPEKCPALRNLFHKNPETITTPPPATPPSTVIDPKEAETVPRTPPAPSRNSGNAAAEPDESPIGMESPIFSPAGRSDSRSTADNRESISCRFS